MAVLGCRKAQMAFAVLLLLCMSAAFARAQSALKVMTQYRGESDQCYANAEWGEELEACEGMISIACEENPVTNSYYDLLTLCFRAETLFWEEKMAAQYEIALGIYRDTDAEYGSARPFSAVRAERLEAEQGAWEAYRDAACATQWSIQDSEHQRPSFEAGCQRYMTFQRVQRLLDAKWDVMDAGVHH